MKVDEILREEAAGFFGRLRDRWVDTPRVWSQLAEERRVALGPGPKLDRELFPRFEDEAEGDDRELESAMRMLGYEE